jgi:hypothetical protein
MNGTSSNGSNLEVAWDIRAPHEPEYVLNHSTTSTSCGKGYTWEVEGSMFATDDACIRNLNDSSRDTSLLPIDDRNQQGSAKTVANILANKNMKIVPPYNVRISQSATNGNVMVIGDFHTRDQSRIEAEEAIACPTQKIDIASTGKSDPSDSTSENGSDEEDIDGAGANGSDNRESGPNSKDEHKARAKNREHARNTRKRKKEYIETLKDSLHALKSEIELEDSLRREKLTTLARIDHQRKLVFQRLFQYRANAEKCYDLWSSILEPNAVVYLPLTAYRSYPVGEVEKGRRKVVGIEGMMKEAASLGEMAQSIGATSAGGNKTNVNLESFCQNDWVAQGNEYMCRWMTRTVNAVECGASAECYKVGMARAKFTRDNKIQEAEIVWDIMSFMQQLRKASCQLHA